MVDVMMAMVWRGRPSKEERTEDAFALLLSPLVADMTCRCVIFCVCVLFCRARLLIFLVF